MSYTHARADLRLASAPPPSTIAVFSRVMSIRLSMMSDDEREDDAIDPDAIDIDDEEGDDEEDDKSEEEEETE